MVLVADRTTPATSSVSVLWTVLSWALWGLFVAEFVLRLVIAPSTSAFLRSNWWQLAFLALPFLRFLRAFSRGARVARGLSTSVRTSRTAARTLSGRVGWLASITMGIVIAATEIVYEFTPEVSYVDVLHNVTLASISGEPLSVPGPAARVLELVLALYATVFFAALAGALGAFFLERRAPGGGTAASGQDGA